MVARFEGKVAVVTGAAHGIGAAIATRLAREGAKVLVADIEDAAAAARAAAIAAAANEAGGTAIGLGVDVRERVATAAMIARAVEAWGRLDILVSNAGIVDRAPFLEMDDALWQRVISTNLYGAFTSGQAAARQMVAQGQDGQAGGGPSSAGQSRGGRIVHVASNSGIFGGRGRAAYGASKAGLINLTQTMAIELAEHGILVNAVAPGATRTRVTGGEFPPETVMARMPLRRFGEPEEIAAVAAFLASDECSFTTGHVYSADGGFTVAGVMEG